MVSNIRYLFLLLPLVLAACNKNSFSLEFDMGKDITDNYNVTYYATDLEGGLTVQAVASIREGRCELKGFTKKPTIVYITRRKSFYPLVVLADAGKKIKFTGDSPDPLAWNVGENDINMALSSWRQSNMEFLTSNNIDSVNKAVKLFIEENPADPVSTILLMNYYDRRSDEREYVELLGKLHGKARDSSIIRLNARADQMYSEINFPARLESLIRRSLNDIDTVRINHRDPVMFFLWQTNFNEKKVMVDSIKSLLKEYPDSMTIIADLCLDVDSTGWRNAVRKDSIDTIKRFWVPKGIMDIGMMKLKVPSLPYYIVFDKEGNQAYRGKDMTEAIKEYRSQQSKKDSISS